MADTTRRKAPGQPITSLAERQCQIVSVSDEAISKAAEPHINSAERNCRDFSTRLKVFRTAGPARSIERDIEIDGARISARIGSRPNQTRHPHTGHGASRPGYDGSIAKHAPQTSHHPESPSGVLEEMVIVRLARGQTNQFARSTPFG